MFSFEVEINNLAASGPKAFEGVLSVKFRSRCLKINRLIKSVASAAAPITEMQGRHERQLSGRALPRILVRVEAALAADLIRRLISKRLE